MNALERLAQEASDDCAVIEVIRPAAIVPEASARAVLMQLALRDVRVGGHWQAEPAVWRRYDRAWDSPDGGPGSAGLLGGVHVAYGIPTRWEITIYRATITVLGAACGWTVAMLCDEALGYGDLTLASCPRADLPTLPRPFQKHLAYEPPGAVPGSVVRPGDSRPSPPRP